MLDEDEFVANQRRYDHPESTTRGARRGLAQVLDMIHRREFPFDYADLTTPYTPVDPDDATEPTGGAL